MIDIQRALTPFCLRAVVYEERVLLEDARSGYTFLGPLCKPPYMHRSSLDLHMHVGGVDYI